MSKFDPDLANMNVLIVDDTPANIDVLWKMLEGEGYRVSVAQSGEVAIKTVARSHPDLILLDVMMPGLDGYETCELLKSDESTRGIPVIFITAKHETEDVIKGFFLGGSDYITKPFRQEEVLARIKTHLSLKKAVRERETLIEELKDAVLKMQDARQESLAKTEFLSRMSHELRTPLHAILGFSQLMERGEDKPLSYHKPKVTEILKAGTRLLNLVNEVLNLSELDSSGYKALSKKIAIGPLVGEMVLFNMPLAKLHGVTIENKVNPEQEVFVKGETERLKHIFNNLLSNAVKYNKEKGTVIVDLKTQDDGMVCISFTDTGNGISKDKQELVFEPFSRLQDEIVVDGVGIGLTVAKRFVEIMQGKITLESEPGAGSCFTVEFPSVPAKDSV